MVLEEGGHRPGTAGERYLAIINQWDSQLQPIYIDSATKTYAYINWELFSSLASRTLSDDELRKPAIIAGALQLTKNTRKDKIFSFWTILKLSIIIFTIVIGFTLINQINLPAPSKQIEKILPNENFKTIK